MEAALSRLPVDATMAFTTVGALLSGYLYGAWLAW